MRLILTAGFSRAKHVIAMAQILSQRGHRIEMVLVVNPISLRRIKTMIRQRGGRELVRAAKRMLGLTRAQSGIQPDPLDQFLQTHQLRHRSLKAWAADHHARYHVVPDLNAPPTIDLVRRVQADGLIYGGGGILRNGILEAIGGRVLNAHSGPLPEIRGMNACEWSLLLGLAPMVTIHFINRGIDTGSTVRTLPVVVEPGDTIDRLRSKCTVLGVEGICDSVESLASPPPPASPQAGHHRQCYVLAPVLKELLEHRLAVGCYAHRA